MHDLKRVLMSAIAGSVLLSSHVSAAEIPRIVGSEALLTALQDDRKVVLVDVREIREQPGVPSISNTMVVRIPWPQQTYETSANEPHVQFYRALRELRRKHPGKAIVFICGVGERSRQALDHAADFGMRSGLSHLEGGLHGNHGDPGLLLSLKMR